MECIAWTRDKEGHELEGPAVSIQMAKDEGWYGRKGSKWKTMPELMLRYRAAAFFGRLYAPEILMGMKATDEIEDIGYEIINESESSSRVNDPSITINKLNAGIEKAAAAPAPAAEQDGEQKEEKMPEKETDPIADNDEELL